MTSQKMIAYVETKTATVQPTGVIRPLHRPGDLVFLDAYHLGRLGRGWHTSQLMTCDAACSHVIAQLIPRLTVDAVLAFLRERVVREYARSGFRIRTVVTDGALVFQDRFSRACREAGIEHRRREAEHHIERVQRAIDAGLWSHITRRKDQRSIIELDQLLQNYLRFYHIASGRFTEASRRTPR